MTTMFQVIDDNGIHGPTVESENPKLDAYKYLYRVTRGGAGYCLTCHEDGCYTATVDGLMPLTFAPVA